MGPLQGYKIIELAGIGPGPFCGMMLADMGAEVITVERSSDSENKRLPNCAGRNKRSIALNLKSEAGINTLLKLVEKADAFMEGFRPGVVERLGIGPEVCLKRNPKLIYGRMTGWGQTGPLAQTSGHDINYISLTGALYAMGRPQEKPVPPLNLVGDFGGGGMFLAFGIVCALLEVQKSGKGQVIDAAMTDGSAMLMAFFNSLHGQKMWSPQRGVNLLDSGAHFYDTYETKDGKYISIGSIEPQFYSLLMEKTKLEPAVFAEQNNPSKWPEQKSALENIFKLKTRAEWCELMEGTDVCFAPVLDFIEAQKHPHNVARQTYIEVDGMTQPAPAPRFSLTVPEVRSAARARGEDTEDVLTDWGFDKQNIVDLRNSNALS